MTDAVIELIGVTKDFGDDVVTRVLKGIDLRVEAGEFTALVGPSGSGKSTLLNLLGLLDRPTGGVLRVLGRDIAGLDDAELTALRGRSIGFVFQFHHLLPALTAVQNVLLPLAITAGHVSAEQRAAAIEGLREVGLEGRADERTTRLSGGQQQRVAIARALIGRPPLVLADEPTGNLDTATADEVFELLRTFNRRSKMAFLVVTHSPELAARCDRVVTLVDGRIVDDRRPTP
ncbi:MAG: ABC transporter ATP-binding protein [Deltaproteobacteria bacterium]|nr:ABC transporter ATP-binding protein [Deltaproteobacteria bacterium]